LITKLLRRKEEKTDQSAREETLRPGGETKEDLKFEMKGQVSPIGRYSIGREANETL